MEVAWHRFRASAAERITGMAGEQQRIKRARGQLPPIVGGKAALSAPQLAEILFVQSIAPLGLINQTLTARSAAAKWIAYWAATTPGSIHGIDRADQEKWARRLAQIPARRESLPTHMLLHRDGESWQEIVLTDDPSQALESSDDGVAVVLDLKRLGHRLAARAELPLAEVGESD